AEGAEDAVEAHQVAGAVQLDADVTAGHLVVMQVVVVSREKDWEPIGTGRRRPRSASPGLCGLSLLAARACPHPVDRYRRGGGRARRLRCAERAGLGSGWAGHNGAQLDLVAWIRRRTQ